MCPQCYPDTGPATAMMRTQDDGSSAVVRPCIQRHYIITTASAESDVPTASSQQRPFPNSSLVFIPRPQII
jgi:hypothetical protein